MPESMLAEVAEEHEVVAAGETQEVTSETAPETPEWLDGKYMEGGKTLQEAIEAQAKGAPGLRKMLGGFSGAPEEYEFSIPEGIEGEVDTELAQYQEFVEFAKESNMSNDTANRLFSMFVGYQNDMRNQVSIDVNEQKSALGDNADERLSNVAKWAGANLDDKDNNILLSMTSTADQVELIERLISKTRGTKVVSPQATEQAPVGFSRADFQAAVNSEKYSTDRAYREGIIAKAKQAEATGRW